MVLEVDVDVVHGDGEVTELANHIEGEVGGFLRIQRLAAPQLCHLAGGGDGAVVLQCLGGEVELGGDVEGIRLTRGRGAEVR
jgi:hypothetical protein